MKKLITLTLVVVAIAAMMFSCKSSDIPCPVYGSNQANTLHNQG